MGFETFVPIRRGRAAADSGPTVRLTSKTGTNGNGTLRISREALTLIGITPKHGDHHYFIVECDRETGALRLTPTEDRFTGRLMNPMNRQITVSRAFFDWTKWTDCRWTVELQGEGLYGAEQESFAPTSSNKAQGS